MELGSIFDEEMPMEAGADEVKADDGMDSLAVEMLEAFKANDATALASLLRELKG
jgi:hypothetical protein